MVMYVYADKIFSARRTGIVICLTNKRKNYVYILEIPTISSNILYYIPSDTNHNNGIHDLAYKSHR